MRRVRQRGRSAAYRAARMAGASVAAFLVAQGLGLVDPPPLVAALTALLVVQATAASTLVNSVQRVLSVVAGAVQELVGGVTPTGKVGRPSKALSLAEAEALLRAAEGSTMGAYVVLSLLTGARTEEVRPSPGPTSTSTATRTPHHQCPRTSWSGAPSAPAATPRPESRAAPWPSLRASTELRAHRTRQTQRSDASPETAGRQRPRLRLRGRHTPGRGKRATRLPTDRRRRRAHRQRLDTTRAPTQLRLPLSDSGVPVEQISRLVGHSGTTVTELIYRKQIRPVLDDGATAMDRIFNRPQAVVTQYCDGTSACHEGLSPERPQHTVPVPAADRGVASPRCDHATGQSPSPHGLGLEAPARNPLADHGDHCYFPEAVRENEEVVPVNAYRHGCSPPGSRSGDRSSGSAVHEHSRKARPCNSLPNSASTTASSNASSPSARSPASCGRPDPHPHRPR